MHVKEATVCGLYLSCFVNIKHEFSVVKGVLLSVIPVISLQRYRLCVLECCHSMSGESTHFKVDVHHVDNINSICSRNGKCFFIFGDARVL